MIKVIVKKDTIKISGHALYDEFGKDIVCAAVSSSVLTTINAILSINPSSIKVDEGNDLIISIVKKDDTVDILLNNMINMLKEIENDYKKNIKVIKED